MNTHPTHTQVGGWGLWSSDCPIGLDYFVVVVACLCFWHRCVFFGIGMWVCFLGIGVCVVGAFLPEVLRHFRFYIPCK